MIIILSPRITPGEKTKLEDFLLQNQYHVRQDLDPFTWSAEGQGLDPGTLASLPGVDRVLATQKSYKLATRDHQKEDTVISLGAVKLGGDRITLGVGPGGLGALGPWADALGNFRDAGAGFCFVMLEGPPGSFIGPLKALAVQAGAQGMALILEVRTLDQVRQTGNLCQGFLIPGEQGANFDLIEACRVLGKPLGLQRPRGASLEAWLLGAQGLLSLGHREVFLVASGEGSRAGGEGAQLNLAEVTFLKELTHLPVVVHPGSALANPRSIPALAQASLGAGAQGLLLEVNLPGTSTASGVSGGLLPQAFETLVQDIRSLGALWGREVVRLPKAPELTAAPASGTAKAPLVRAAFQGEHGAYSEMAVFQVFPKATTQAVPLKTFREVFNAVLEGQVNYGVVPVENALAGSINDNYDLLLQFPDLHIVGETQVRIEHNLIGLPGTPLEAVKKVLSHPQGLAQSTAFLDQHPQWERVSFYDTAGSVAHVAATKDPSLAAIASSEAARVYGMEILVPGVETNHRNFTRFFVLAPLNQGSPGPWVKASLVFSTPDEAGALARCLNLLASRGLNLKRLESRPIAGRPWAYNFYTDVELPKDQGIFDQVLQDLGLITSELRVLGRYSTNIL